MKPDRDFDLDSDDDFDLESEASVRLRFLSKRSDLYFRFLSELSDCLQLSGVLVQIKQDCFIRFVWLKV